MSFVIQNVGNTTGSDYLSSVPIERALADLQLIVDKQLPDELKEKRAVWLLMVNNVIELLADIDRSINRASTLAEIEHLNSRIEKLRQQL